MKRNILFGIAAVVLVFGMLGGGYMLGYRAGSLRPQIVTVQGVKDATSSVSVDFGTFWQAWSTLDQYYLRAASSTPQDRVYGAIKGMVQSAGDPYTEFFNPKESKQFQSEVQGNFGGIGAEIGMKESQIVVIAPLKNSPAEHAGLRSGDMIVKINSSSTENLTVDEAVSLIRGPEGSKVTLNVFRQGWNQTKDFSIVRQNIQVPTLDFSMKGDIAHIQLYEFNANAPALFAEAVRQVQVNHAKGIVLDLRDDPGGYLDVAVDIAGWLLPRNTLVVSEESRSGSADKLYSSGDGTLDNLPIVVLVNGGSASAAEILAGTLRDNRHAELVGTQSFGKGTVQEVVPLRDDSTLKVTIAHWVLPSGKILENGGLKPDVTVQQPDQPTPGQDPQLDKALQVVRSKIH